MRTNKSRHPHQTKNTRIGAKSTPMRLIPHAYDQSADIRLQARMWQRERRDDRPIDIGRIGRRGRTEEEKRRKREETIKKEKRRD